MVRRLNRSYPRRRNSSSVSIGVPTHKRSTSSNTENFDADPRNRSSAKSNSKSYMKNKRIQCRECTSFRHIRAEWANILKTKNNSFNASRSDGDSEYSKDDESNFIVFASRIDNTRVAETKIKFL